MGCLLGVLSHSLSLDIRGHQPPHTSRKTTQLVLSQPRKGQLQVTHHDWGPKPGHRGSPHAQRTSHLSRCPRDSPPCPLSATVSVSPTCRVQNSKNDKPSRVGKDSMLPLTSGTWKGDTKA